MSTPEAPTFGPCTAWITAEDVAANCTVLDSSGDPSVYDTVALEASQILWAASGRQFSGVCGPVTVRPCVPTCGCWPLGSWDGFTWNTGGFWIGGGGNGISAVQGWVGGGGCYTSGCCGMLSRVKLAGYPVVAIDEVLIDGNVIAPENYRLDQWKWLTYLDDADGNPQRWPACQNLARDDSEQGTFAVTYTHGIAPPELGLQAALELACALARADAECGMPPGATQYARQGVQVELQLRRLLGELPPSFAGMPIVQAFLATVNPNGLKRRSAFWSPDSTQYAQRVGS